MTDTENTKPVKVSPGAYAALSYKMRQWTGWPTGILTLGETGTPSPYAACWHDPKFEIVINPEHLLLNPNRVLNTVTPFRLRQEAVLTGALLHEAGHARHSHWQPGRYGNSDKAVHGDGQAVSDLVLEFAKTIEEARVEGLIAGETTEIGAHGLAWTMRCSAIRVLPFTEVSLDPAQAVLDVLCGWVLRAGRVIATSHHMIERGVTVTTPHWVHDYNNLLREVATEHITATKLKASGGESTDENPWGFRPSANPEYTTAVTALREALIAGDEASKPGSTFMVDTAKEILDLLFPASEQENLEAGSGCQEDSASEDDAAANESDDEGDSGAESPSESGDNGEGDESGEDGEGNTEPEDEGSGEDPGAGDSGSDESDHEDEFDGGFEPVNPSPSGRTEQAKTQAAVDAIESEAASQAAQEKAEETAEPSEGPDPSQGEQAEQASQSDGEAGDDKPQTPQRGAGNQRGEGVRNLHYRQPVKEERLVKGGAEQFLRNIIDPSEKGKLQVTDAPTASVDGAALSAWKAGGQNTAPLFFRRIKRTEQPAPPVKIAILVDVSASMDILQAPSALLSWALSAACLDLRNFAGRGVQVESTLIHWGSSARVIQPNGKPMPGIHMDDCMESTIAMHDALDLVAQELPGFFDPMVKDENRLLVQFTDWELGWGTLTEVTRKIDKALTNGVNMLSIVPQDYSWRSTCLDPIIASVARPKGRSALLKYNPDRPGEVWTAAAEVLSGSDSNYGF